MKSRCNNPKDPCFDKYGGRGIYHDERWHSFCGFLKDMGERPGGLELDRVDNDGPYSKENCRWVTRSQNMANRRVLHGKGLPRGVRKRGKKFYATIRINNQDFWIGSYNEMEKAEEGYLRVYFEWYGKMPPGLEKANKIVGEE